jgi:hydrogenase maturation protein HypF
MERRAITVRGIVQGVGFRPFVHGLASTLGLGGFVRNTPEGVVIEVEGAPGALDRFELDLLARAPAAAAIEECVVARTSVQGDATFRIDESALAGAAHAPRIPPDAATCAECLRELFDPGNRRHLYPFITCAVCGPRLTVITAAPYDRERTTMAAFEMCARCRAEYENASDRRFHAESIACAACGPRVKLLDSARAPVEGDPFRALARALAGGAIAAVKGLGGYHLACDALNAAAVVELRRRKHRDEKPFAIVFGALEDIEAVCEVDAAARQLLQSPSRPVVLLHRAESGMHGPCRETAPGSDLVGAMLPSAPVHHLLMRAVARPLVMTSGNRSNEPIAIDDADALARLADIADVFLVNDRPIRVRCDDGVSRVAGGMEMPVRRSRGHAPRPLRLPVPCGEPTLAAGGHLKNTFALARAQDAFISHHIGDLDDYTAHRAFRDDIALYERLFGIDPRVIAHDLHPDYESTRYARERAQRDGLETIAVQHHHAHVASAMAEHGLTDPVIGVAFDGSGYGGDGTVWGGEFLVGDARAVRRAAHLRAVPLPGGEQAVKEPWRMAVSYLRDAGEATGAFASEAGAGAHQLRLIERMIERGLNAPLTSSAGRLFDAVAAIAGLRVRMSFEGQAAMELEALAAGGIDSGYPHAITAGGMVDTRPMIQAAAADARRGAGAAVIARRFHAGLADAVCAMCIRLRDETGLADVVLTGGVFLNVVLTLECERQLTLMGFRVYRHRLVPPNDGGLSLGQLYVAAASRKDL